MSINVNRNFYINPNWKNNINKDLEMKPQKLEAEPTPKDSGGGINPKPQPYNGPAPDIQEILKNLDNPNIPKF